MLLAGGVVGLVGLTVLAAYWMITGQLNPALVSVFATLAGAPSTYRHLDGQDNP